MRWPIYLIVAIVLLVLCIVAIGLALPKAHRATRMARFKQSPETVFAAIAGPQDWRTATEQLPNDGGPRRWRERPSHRWIALEEVESAPPRLYRVRIADKDLPFSGTWTYEVAPTGAGDDGIEDLAGEKLAMV